MTLLRGAVQKVQTLETLKLPGYAAKHPGAWDPKTVGLRGITTRAMPATLLATWKTLVIEVNGIT